MGDRLFRKGLVFGVIFLFLGIAFQPINNAQIQEIKSNDNCNCENVNTQDLARVNRLLDRIEVKIKNIMLTFGYIPSVKLKCGEILDILYTLDDDSTICDVLETINTKLEQMFYYVFNKSEEFPVNGSLILSYIYASIGFAIIFGGIIPIFLIASSLECSWTIPDWPYYSNQKI